MTSYPPYRPAALVVLGLLLWLTTLPAGWLRAQSPCNLPTTRYKDRLFPLVSRVNDVTYGRANDYLGFPQDLKLDVYMPANDTLTARPVVLMFFGGAFVLGQKTDADMTAWCDSLASLGYVAVAVQYRLGLNTTDANSATRAAYRAVQDSRAAIRYLKEFHQTYRIDTNFILVGGESAGAITAIHTAYLDLEAERPQATYRYLLEPDLGCLDCAGNTYAHTVQVRGVLNLWGATLDTNFIQPNDAPMVTIHGTDDAVVPYDAGVPFTVGYTFPRLQGALPLNARLQNLGIYHEFYPYQGQGHVFYGIPAVTVTFPNQYWPPVYAQGRDFFHKLLQFETGPITGPNQATKGQTATYSVPAHPGSKYCWQVTGGSVVGPPGAQYAAQVQILWDTNTTTGNITVTEVDSRDVIGSAVTLPVALANPATVQPNAQAPVWSLGPNPATGHTAVSLTATLPTPATLTVLDALGRTVYTAPLPAGDARHTLPANTWPAGLYTVRLYGPFGADAHKLLCLPQ